MLVCFSLASQYVMALLNKVRKKLQIFQQEFTFFVQYEMLYGHVTHNFLPSYSQIDTKVRVNNTKPGTEQNRLGYVICFVSLVLNIC